MAVYKKDMPEKDMGWYRGIQEEIVGIVNELHNRYRVRLYSTHPPYRVVLVPTYRCSLGCTFCFAKGLEQKFPNDITVEDMRFFLEWLKRKRLRTFLLSGGEPTEYAHFSELMHWLKIYGMEVVLVSNNLFGDDILPLLSRKTVRYSVLNYNKEGFSKEQHQRFKANLVELSDRGLPIGLRLNIYQHVIDREIIALARTYKCNIYLSLSCPGYSSNTYVQKEQISEIAPAVVFFVRECKQNGVPIYFGRPLLPCSFSTDDIRTLKPAAVRYRCNPIPVVNPDLSIFPCLNIFKAYGSLSDFADIKAMRKAIVPFFDSLRQVPLFERCVQCTWRVGRKCQGGCLAYKLLRG